MTTRWDPGQYLKFGEERGRPFDELISRIGHDQPKRVVDLGCGPGTTTALLADRWPDARIVGIDSSPEMIAEAQRLARPGSLEFEVGDLREWDPGEPVDVVICAATFQWVPGHADLFESIVARIAAGGVFAFQVPGNFDQPSHTRLYELARSDRWGSSLAHLVRPDPVLEPAAYLEVLLDCGTAPDVWTTTYFHLLHGRDAVLEWVSGTALRPYLSALEHDPAAAEEFVGAYASALRASYPQLPSGLTVFPFRRIFAVASRV